MLGSAGCASSPVMMTWGTGGWHEVSSSPLTLASGALTGSKVNPWFSAPESMAFGMTTATGIALLFVYTSEWWVTVDKLFPGLSGSLGISSNFLAATLGGSIPIRGPSKLKELCHAHLFHYWCCVLYSHTQGWYVGAVSVQLS